MGYASAAAIVCGCYNSAARSSEIGFDFDNTKFHQKVKLKKPGCTLSLNGGS